MQNEAAFVDANVFLDVARKRKGWKASATTLGEIKRRNGFLSALTVAIIYFIKLRKLSPVAAKRETQELIEGLRVAAVTPEIIRQAFENKNIEDFEDAIQFYCTKSVANILVTRNERDYAAVKEELEIITPEDFLRKYKS